MAIVTRDNLSHYAGYETSGVDSAYLTFLDTSTLDWANKMTGQAYTEETAPESFKLLCVMLVAEIFRARQRLGAEASEINLEGVTASYLQLSTKDNISRLIESNRKIVA